MFPFIAEPQSGLYQLFLKYKPKDLSWFEVDVEILSPTTVIFHIYDHRNTVYGFVRDGLLHRFKLTVDAKILWPYIDKKLAEMAMDEYDRRERDRISKEIAKVRLELSEKYL